MMGMVAIVTVIGLVCLMVDAGCRVFGSYSRTMSGAVVRITGLVLMGLLFLCPYLLLLLLQDTSLKSFFLFLCMIESCLTVALYLYPPRCGIHPFVQQDRPADSVDRNLTPGIELRHEYCRIPHLKQPVQALVVSDLHCNNSGGLEQFSAACSALDCEYDFVFILGDLTERNDLIPSILKVFSGVKNRYGIFLVRGNHDDEAGRSEIIEAHAKNYDITVLSNDAVYIPSLELTLLGLETPWREGRLPQEIQGVCIALSHTPDNIKIASRHKASLMLAGHTHGGKVRLPGGWALLVPSRYGRFLDRGWFRFKDTRMLITSGIGYFPGRFGQNGQIVHLAIYT